VKKLVLLIFILPVVLLAQGKSESKIKGYVLNHQGADKVGLFITPSGSIENSASCNTTNRFVVDANTPFGRAALSSILAAFQAGDELRLFGDGTCSSGLSLNSESLRKICTKEGPC
jgi:hypothetical protein